MSLRVFRAIYGEREGSHSLLTRTPAVEAPFSEIVRYTDKPANLHLKHAPFFSGFAHDGFYVLLKTFHDRAASRPGMVRTHAILSPLNETAHLDNLQQLLDLFPERISKDLNAIRAPEEIRLEEKSKGGEEEQLSSASASRELASLAHKLLEEAKSEEPVVWKNGEGFERIVAELWRGLWPSIRKKLVFRCGAAPFEKKPFHISPQIHLVAAPASSGDKRGKIPSANPAAVSDAPTPAEAYLLRHEKGEPLRQFQEALGANLKTLGDLQLLQDCHTRYTKLSDLDASQATALVKFAGHLSPDPSKGEEVKKQALSRMSELLSKGKAGDIKRLRNFDPRPFKSGQQVTEDTIRSWASSNLLDTSKAEGLARLIACCFGASEVAHWKRWRAAILKTFTGLIKRRPQEAAEVLWGWWHEKPKLVSELASRLPETSEIEEQLIATAPSRLPKVVATPIRRLAVQRGWILLHAAVVASTLSPEEAYRRQLKVDSKSSHFEGLRQIASRVSPEQTLKAAVAAGDGRLRKLAGEACAEDPGLLSNLDAKSAAWRSIWLHKLKAARQDEPWKGIQQPGRQMTDLVDLVLQGVSVDKELLLRLAQTEHADLTKHPRRSQAWGRFPPEVKRALLKATAEGWARRFTEGPGIEERPEKPLRDYILEHSRLAILLQTQSEGAVSCGLETFNMFHELRERDFKKWLRGIMRSRPPFSPVDASSIGRLINKRKWKSAAYLIYSKVGHRADLRPALSECRSQLGYWDSFLGRLSGRLDDTPIGADEWWQALVRLMANLYSGGPSEVWERAGGDLSLIDLNQSGRAQWKDALSKLRKRGGGSDITIVSLLEAAQEDYHANHKLNIMAEKHREFIGA